MGVMSLGIEQLLPESAPGDVTVPEFLLVLGLSFVLSMFIGWVYQRTYRGSRYTQDYVHTLIIMGTVVSLVIMLVGDNVARAFGIFAAFSIIRFRRALPEARDVGFIFFAMAVGLATGAQQYYFAVLTALLVGGVVLLISHYDVFAPERSTHKLRVEVPDELDYEEVLAGPFGRLCERAVLNSVRHKGSSEILELRYEVTLRSGFGPRDVVAELKAVNGGLKVILTSIGNADLES